MLYKDMTDEALRDAYWANRQLLANAVNGRMARSAGRTLRNVELIERIADRRGLSLS